MTASAAVAAAQQRDVGGSGTVRECADARAFERHRRADMRIFVLCRGRRDNSVDSIVIVDSDGVARGNVQGSLRCAAADDNAPKGDADNIAC